MGWVLNLVCNGFTYYLFGRFFINAFLGQCLGFELLDLYDLFTCNWFYHIILQIEHNINDLIREASGRIADLFMMRLVLSLLLSISTNGWSFTFWGILHIGFTFFCLYGMNYLLEDCTDDIGDTIFSNAKHSIIVLSTFILVGYLHVFEISWCFMWKVFCSFWIVCIHCFSSPVL